MGIARNLSTMPRRADDAVSGEVRIALFLRDFAGYSKAAMNFLHDTARRELRFFPSPKECFDILDRWERCDGPSVARRLARQRAKAELTARHNEALQALRERSLDQAAIDALPDHWKRQGEVLGYLRLWPDGRYSARADTAGASEEVLAESRKEAQDWLDAWHRAGTVSDDGDGDGIAA